MTKNILTSLLFFIPFILTAQLNDSWVDAGSIDNYKHISRHAATLLQDGRVLVTGGQLYVNDTLHHPSVMCFIYSPASNNWTRVSSMNYGKECQSATLLKDGKVLVIGGDDIGASINKCELYDPTSDIWYKTDSLKNARSQSSSILLPDGNVMVIGGQYFDHLLYNPIPVNDCEIFNVATQSWKAVDTLLEPLENYPSVGIVNDSLIYAVQFNNFYGLSAQIYNITTDQWSLLPKAKIISSPAKAELIADSLLVVIDSDGRCEIFNFNTWIWEIADSTDFNRKNNFHLSKLNDQYILVHSGGISRTDIFDVKTRSWIKAADMPEKRNSNTSTVLKDGTILVIGGNDSLASMAIRYIPDSTLVGIKNSKKELPLSFTLYQNYPNPFNPSTRIKYSIPQLETLHGMSQQVQLKIYDILGREIATLVNKKLSPGNYEVTFDATGLPSGIYFYKLTAGNFTDVKKMILMK